MRKLKFEIVTAEKVVLSDEVDLVVVPGVEGQMALLPMHAPIMTMLQPGEIMLRKAGQESSLFVSGGFLEVMNDKVTILADSAERGEEIDLARAEQAKKRAEERMELRAVDVDLARAEAALRRSLARMKVAEKMKTRRQRP
ncbi:MAG: F0F1 ATP synthase subunit epsilon [Chloroflexi bacterium]|nr:F0F1 ATP synthase subunit epsilon [Chloroflexota bacterium]